MNVFVGKDNELVDKDNNSSSGSDSKPGERIIIFVYKFIIPTNNYIYRH